jgi:hypothetical protein
MKSERIAQPMAIVYSLKRELISGAETSALDGA